MRSRRQRSFGPLKHCSVSVSVSVCITLGFRSRMCFRLLKGSASSKLALKIPYYFEASLVWMNATLLLTSTQQLGFICELQILSAKPKPKRKGGPGGLNKLCDVSPQLQVIVGHPTLPRTEIVKQLWVYIRKHHLQDHGNKRKIICNDELRLVFETDCTDMFKMNKLLAKHIIALEPSKQPVPKKPKVAADSVTKSSQSGPSVIISEALANFFSGGGTEMLQYEVLQRIWEYIKVNRLEVYICLHIKS